MSNVATYARLIKPPMFRFKDPVDFIVQFSEDLMCTHATLRIVGSACADPKMTIYIDTAIGGQAFATFHINANALGRDPTQQDPTWPSGKVYAYVEFRKHEGLSEEPIFVSNKVLVDLLVMWETDFRFDSMIYNATSSVQTVRAIYTRRTALGTAGSTDVNSYRFFLYDSDKNLIRDGGELYDWESAVLSSVDYTFDKLRDNHTYYVGIKITLVGGYVLSRMPGDDEVNPQYATINVNYNPLPSGSDEFTLTNLAAKGIVEMKLDLTGVQHTKVVFSQCIPYKYDYLEVCSTNTSSDIVTYNNSYALPGRDYLMRAVVFNGDLLVNSYYQYITPSISGIVISDIYGCYSALGRITKHPISRNDRGQIIEAMDSVYPYNIINGSDDYDSGSISALFAETDDECNPILDGDGNYTHTLRSWLNNGRTKLLKYYNGECWLVALAGVQTTDPENNDVYNSDFTWTQVGDADNYKDYVRLGLVIS